MSQHPSSPTPLDVLDNWRLVHDVDGDHALAKLGDDAFDDFVDRLSDHAAAWHPPEREPTEIRLTLDVGGFWGSLLLPATAVTFTDPDIDAADAQNASGGVLSYLRRRYAAAFLYADQVVDVDPLVMISRVHRDRRAYLMSVLINLYETIRPAIEAGILLMAPDVSQDDMARVDKASLADEKPFSDYYAARLGHRRSFEWLFLREVRRAAQVASRTSANVLAAHPWVWEYVAYIGGGAAEPRDIAVATALLHAELPVVAGIPAKTLVAIHQEEQAFVEWRGALRTTARLIRSSPAEGSFAEEAEAVYQEALLPRIAAVKKSVSRSAALRGALLDEPVRAAFGAVFTAGSAAAAGLPIKGVVLSAGVGAASKVAYAGLRPPRPAGSDLIISMLPAE